MFARTEVDGDRHRRHRPTGRDLRRSPDAPLQALVVDPAGTIADRVRDEPDVELVVHLEVRPADLVAALPDHLDVAVLVVRDTDPGAVQDLRRLHRARPGLRLVAVGDGTRHFEDAFDAGVDAWIATDADDTTLRAALRGRPTGR